MTKIRNFNDWKESIQEKKIGTIEDTLRIRVELNTTIHAEERKTRHGEENPITDKQIISTVDRALPEIAENQLKDIDRIGRKYWIFDKNMGLNIIGQLVRDQNEELVFKVITVMVKKTFRGSSDTRKIEV